MAEEMTRGKRPLVSVIVPIYNAEAYLEKCVQSVLHQDMEDYELILVNDGSPDRCGEICQRFARQDARVRYIAKENGGLSDARNAGIDAAAGEYLSFIDADDYVEPGYLSGLLSLIRSAPGCKVSQANHFVERNGKCSPCYPDQGAVFTRREAFEAVLYHDRVDVSACAKLYHRSVFEELRFAKGRLFEDTLLFGDILLRTPCFVYGGRPLYHYVQRENSIVNQVFSEKNLQYLAAVEHLTEIALQVDPGLEAGCRRRMTHARLSVMRYMENCPRDDLALRDELRRDILRDAPRVLSDRRTPRRDRLAAVLLRLGYRPFFIAWKVYGIIRK